MFEEVKENLSLIAAPKSHNINNTKKYLDRLRKDTILIKDYYLSASSVNIPFVTQKARGEEMKFIV